MALLAKEGHLIAVTSNGAVWSGRREYDPLGTEGNFRLLRSSSASISSSYFQMSSIVGTAACGGCDGISRVLVPR